MLDLIRANAQSWGVKIAFGIIILVFVFWGVGGLTGGPSTVILTVNGEPITIQEFQRKYEQLEQQVRAQYPDLDAAGLKAMQLKQQLIQNLILENLIMQEAKRVGIVVTPVELRKLIESFPAFHNAEGKFDPDAYVRVIKAQRNTPGNFEAELRNNMLMNKLRADVTAGAFVPEAEVRDLFRYEGERRILEYVFYPLEDYTSKVTVDDAQIKDYYEANQASFTVPPQADVEYLLIGAEALAAAQNISDAAVSEYYEKNAAQFATPEMVRARHILILSNAKASAEDQAKAKAKIEEIAQRIKAGEDFGTVAKEVSEDPGSGPQGGELGWFAHGQMVPEFDKASFALNPGELSEPVKTQFGWHLIQLEEKKAAGQKPLDEVKDQIRTRLAQDEASGKVQEALEQVQLAVIGGKSLKEAGEPLKLAPQETGLVNTTELTEKMGIKPENLPALLAAKPGTVLDTPFVTKTGYVIAKVNESKPQTVKPLDAVKDDIKARLQQDKARTLAFEAANAERKTFTADLPKELQGKLKKTEPVGRQGYMGELGMNAELAKAAFAAKVNEWFPVAYTLDGGAVIARVAEVVTPSDEDWKTAAPQITDAVLNAKREQMFRGFLSLLRSNAKIELKNETIL
ncbi:MAG TPA: SurA N-terminal domain-containing protein, partial [Bilophila wadsworthia]